MIFLNPGKCCNCSVSTCLGCFGGSLPTTLYLTDANGTIAITRSGGTWSGSYTFSASGVTAVFGGGGGCCTFVTGTASITVSYFVTCADGTPPKLTVSRSFRTIFTGDCAAQAAQCPGGSYTSGPWSLVDTAIPLGQCCGSPSNPSAQSVLLTSAVSTCNPMTWSGTLSSPPYGIPDPVGGTVSISV